MTDIQEIQISDIAPDYSATTIHNESAIKRGKENQAILDKGGNFTPLFSKSGSTDIEKGVVDNMEHEYRVLCELRDTGITPEPLLFKTNEDRSESHLLTSKLPGQSIEGLMADGIIPEIPPHKFAQILQQILASLEAVHSRGIVIKDINSGTFVIDGAVTEADPVRVSIQVAVEAFLGKAIQVDTEDMARIDQGLYRIQQGKIEAGIRRYVHSRKDVGVSNIHEESIEDRIAKVTDRAMLNITLPYLLRNRGLSLDQETEDYICAALNPSVADRPTYAINEEPELEIAA